MEFLLVYPTSKKVLTFSFGGCIIVLQKGKEITERGKDTPKKTGKVNEMMKVMGYSYGNIMERVQSSINSMKMHPDWWETQVECYAFIKKSYEAEIQKPMSAEEAEWWANVKAEILD